MPFDLMGHAVIMTRRSAPRDRAGRRTPPHLDRDEHGRFRDPRRWGPWLRWLEYVFSEEFEEDRDLTRARPT